MAAITSASLGVAAAGYSIYEGEQKKKRAKDELNNYERQDLVNAYENIEISTIGSDLQREETQRTVATIVDSLQGGGSRAITSSLPQIQAGVNQSNRQIQKDLDDQVKQREYAISGEDSRIMGIKEHRDSQNIQALSSQYDAGNQNVWNGVNGAIAATGSLGRTLSGDASTTSTRGPQSASLSNSITPAPYNPFDSIPQFSIPTVKTLFTENNMYS